MDGVIAVGGLRDQHLSGVSLHGMQQTLKDIYRIEKSTAFPMTEEIEVPERRVKRCTPVCKEALTPLRPATCPALSAP